MVDGVFLEIVESLPKFLSIVKVLKELFVCGQRVELLSLLNNLVLRFFVHLLNAVIVDVKHLSCIA